MMSNVPNTFLGYFNILETQGVMGLPSFLFKSCLVQHVPSNRRQVVAEENWDFFHQAYFDALVSWLHPVI